MLHFLPGVHYTYDLDYLDAATASWGKNDRRRQRSVDNSGRTDNGILGLSSAVLLALQQTGVIAVDPDTFEPWPDQTDFPAEIIRQWRALGRHPSLPDIAWLERIDPQRTRP